MVLVVPVRAAVAVALSFLPVAVRVALSLVPVVVGAYVTVTLHILFGPRLVAVQLSARFVKATEPDKETVNATVAEPPEFLSTNVWTRPDRR